MVSDLFKLLSTYELPLRQGDIIRPVRIEIFRSIEDCALFKARIWLQNTYNLYPMVVNTGSKGEDLHRTHSCDDLNVDITSLIAEDSSLMTGKTYKNENEFLKYLESRIIEELASK